ncbi:MAG: hypothetical protein AVDCRST_MAG88-1628 [uncultured Thermomicrobiales bacterium]|uniref:Uncharacterized protein n=1 Tax=uncultured Thermomicrobiales bacterium TaxID=1645740 RepID=A0A6J4UZ77_9BACT|nr:MAG: hypothetical protein AVDCRST_MAG88-1628 [uncultured Thermomicrobiales bacterium]
MITNGRERACAQRQLARLAETRAAYLADPSLDPAQRTVLVGGLDATLAAVEEELAEFEALAGGQVPSAERPLAEVGTLLIQARIAAGLTQRGLAERHLAAREQQVQQAAATRYVRSGSTACSRSPRPSG